MLNATEMKINIDDTYMNVIRFGSGSKNLVIIAGLCLCGLEEHGEGIAELYKDFCGEYTVYVIERKKVVKVGYSIQQMAEDTCRVLNEIGVKKTSLYGVSQGGMIAQCIAAYHPEMVEKMAICSSQCRTTKTAKIVVGKFAELAEKKNVIDLNRYFLKQVFSKECLEKNKDMLPDIERQGTPEDCERFKILAMAVENFDIYDDMDKIQCPTFVIGDRQDNVLGVEGSYDIAERLKCDLYIYEEYSHGVYDEAEDIKDRLLEFFRK